MARLYDSRKRILVSGGADFISSRFTATSLKLTSKLSDLGLSGRFSMIFSGYKVEKRGLTG